MTDYSGPNPGTAGTNNATGDGGVGGVGLSIYGNDTLTGTGIATGGDGGDGSANGGIGGVGVYIGGFNSLTNNGVIVGGVGGSTTTYTYGLSGGDGGIGVNADNGATLINNNSITGGRGGYGRYQGGDGGIGVQLSQPTLAVNNGTITGGRGGSSYYVGGDGGVGVELISGGTLTNAGTISGGDKGIGTLSKAGDAVHFGNGNSALIIKPGAVFNGQVTATESYFNIIQLDDGPNAGAISFPQFTGFDRIKMESGADWTIDGAVGSAAPIDMGVSDAATDRLGIGDAEAFLSEISGFDDSDVIDLENVANIIGHSFNAVNGFLTLQTPGGEIVLDFANPSSFSGFIFSFSSDGLAGTNITLETPCYCPGTLIRTERGEVPVESLVIGDRVVTVSGALEPIRWIGRRSYAGRFIAGKKNILPVCIKADALSEGLPKRDLLISPLHAMYLDGMLVPAGELVNGLSIVQRQVEAVEYLHIELAHHDVIWAEGAASETFVDDESRGMFRNAHEYAALYPDAECAPARYCAPRVTEGYALEEIRRRIARRAGLRAAA